MNDWRPCASLETIRRRAQLLDRVRSFFRQRNVTEVTTPALTASGVTDIHIESIAIERPRAFLRTSPEYYHKRLLAAGMGDIYELGPVFRAAESGRHHQPEFTLLEWYRVGWEWQALATEVVELIRCCQEERDRDWPVRYLTWREGFGQVLSIDPLNSDQAELRELAADAPDGSSRDMLLDFLFATRIQPTFPARTLTVVHDYPAAQAALARLRPDDPCVAERFEVFAGTIELANGYRELSDPQQQRARFEADNRTRRALERTPMPIDEEVLDALDSGLPECAGVALGIDRLAMVAFGYTDIARVMPFRSPATG